MARERRNSMDLPNHFQDFPPEFDRQEPNMRRIISEVEKICDETRRRKDRVPRRAALAAAGAGASAFALVPFTGGISLAVFGGAAAAAGAVLIHDKITDKKTLDKVKKLVEEFCAIAEVLTEIEKERREMLEKLDKKPEVISVQTLMDRLRSMFFIFTKDSTLQRLLEVTGQCKRILEQLELKFFRNPLRDVDTENE